MIIVHKPSHVVHEVHRSRVSTSMERLRAPAGAYWGPIDKYYFIAFERFELGFKRFELGSNRVRAVSKPSQRNIFFEQF